MQFVHDARTLSITLLQTDIIFEVRLSLVIQPESLLKRWSRSAVLLSRGPASEQALAKQSALTAPIADGAAVIRKECVDDIAIFFVERCSGLRPPKLSAQLLVLSLASEGDSSVKRRNPAPMVFTK